MELFEVEIMRQELLASIQKEDALDEVKKFTLSSIVTKTQEMSTLTAIKVFLDEVQKIRLEVTEGVVRDAIKAYEEEARSLMKEIESDYHKVQQQELMRLMEELS